MPCDWTGAGFPRRVAEPKESKPKGSLRLRKTSDTKPLQKLHLDCGTKSRPARLAKCRGFAGSPTYPLSGSYVGRPASVHVTVARSCGGINSGDSKMGNELGGPLISRDDLFFGIALTATAAVVLLVAGLFA